MGLLVLLMLFVSIRVVQDVLHPLYGQGLCSGLSFPGLGLESEGPKFEA